MDKKNKNPNVPNLRFLQFTNEWSKFAVSELLNTYPTNSLSWDKLSYIEKSKIKNIHYGIIHNGFKSTIINGNNQFIPFVNNSFTPKSYTLLQDGDLILADASEDRKDVGRPVEMINVDNQKIISGLHTIHARNKTNLLINGFKGFYFQSYAMKKQIYKIANGSKIYGISPANFNELFISVPSKEEQQKIVNLLQKIEDRIETQIKIISSIESQIKSINNHVAFDSATNELSIGNLFDIKTNSKILEKHDGKYCIVDMGTIDSNGNYITGKYTDDITSILTKGTLVMPKDDIGGGKIICKTLYINESNKYVLSDHVFALKLRNSKYNPLYFSSLINSQYHNHNLKRLVTGSAQLGINQENLNKYKLRFSDCLELQKKYSKLIQLINEKLFIEKKLLYDLYNQKNYLMKNMFI